MRLYRVADKDSPYFRKGSYWALSAQYARDFQRWSEGNGPFGSMLNPAPESPGSRQLYSTVAEGRVLDLRPEGFVALDKVETLADWAADEGYDWLVFYPDGLWEGRINPEAVYLSDDPPSDVYPVEEQ